LTKAARARRKALRRKIHSPIRPPAEGPDDVGTEVVAVIRVTRTTVNSEDGYRRKSTDEIRSRASVTGW
jgi:hypothetical protein